MRSTRFGSDLTDAQWKAIAPLFDRVQFRRHHPRGVLDALFYLVKTGCQWRALPRCFPPWTSVYDRFRTWRRSGLLAAVHDRLRRLAKDYERLCATSEAMVLLAMSRLMLSRIRT